ncbi:MAG: DNA-binding protein [Oligoflexia bacterium]|nr:DNA-binding protein [Oligoflexia bacterium]
MSKRLVDYEQVAKACDSLVKDGQRPSMRNVRKIIGHGNMSTILSYLREWKEKNNFIPCLLKNQDKEESSGNNHFRKPVTQQLFKEQVDRLQKINEELLNRVQELNEVKEKNNSSNGVMGSQKLTIKNNSFVEEDIDVFDSFSDRENVGKPWEEKSDLIVFLAMKIRRDLDGDCEWDNLIGDIAHLLGVSYESVTMRIKYFDYLAGQKGISNPPKSIQNIHRKFYKYFQGR